MRLSLCVVSASCCLLQGCSRLITMPVALQIPRGNGCRVISLPKGDFWKADRPDTSLGADTQFWIGYSDFEFRRPASTAEERILLIGARMKGHRSATNHYRLNLHQGSVLEPVTQTEWETASGIEAFGRSSRTPDDFRIQAVPSPTRPGRNAFVFSTRYPDSPALTGGGVFDTTGYSDRGKILFSGFTPLPRWLAVASFRRRQTSDSVWIDFFRGSDAKRLLTIRGNGGSTSGAELEGNGVWILERYFVFPLGVAMQKFMLCDAEQINATAK